MALLFVDGFEHYETLLDKWDLVVSVSGGVALIRDTYSRTGFKSVELQGPGRITKVFNSASTVILGAAIRILKAPSDNNQFIWLFDGAVEFEQVVRVTYSPSKRLQIERRTGSSSWEALNTSSVVNLIDGWHFIELKWVSHVSAGAYEVRVNGVNVMSASGIDTSNGWTSEVGVGGAGFIGFGSLTVDNGYFLDDVYICDGTGATNNNFLGDSQVLTGYPDEDGTYLQWTALGTGEHQSEIDENPPDDDITYIFDSVSGRIDTFDFDPVDTNGGVIRGVQLNISATKTDAGAQNIQGYNISGVTEDAGTSKPLGSGEYTYYREIWPEDPNTSATWVEANLNNAEFGVKIP